MSKYPPLIFHFSFSIEEQTLIIQNKHLMERLIYVVAQQFADKLRFIRTQHFTHLNQAHWIDIASPMPNPLIDRFQLTALLPIKINR